MGSSGCATVGSASIWGTGADWMGLWIWGLSENESVPICSDLFKVLVEDGTSLKLNASLRVDPDQISRNSRVASQLDRHCASEAPIEAESPRNGHIVSLFLRALFVSEGGPDRSRTKVSGA